MIVVTILNLFINLVISSSQKRLRIKNSKFFYIFLRENFNRASAVTFTKAKVLARSKFNTRLTMVALN